MAKETAPEMAVEDQVMAATDKKISTGLITYWVVCLAFIVLIFGYISYKEAIIFPPTLPTNLEELATWDKDDLRRIDRYYKCDSLPYKIENPDIFVELRPICDAIGEQWMKKYREERSIEALEGIERLEQRE